MLTTCSRDGVQEIATMIDSQRGDDPSAVAQALMPPNLPRVILTFMLASPAHCRFRSDGPGGARPGTFSRPVLELLPCAHQIR